MRIGIIGTSAIAGHFVEGARLAGGIDIAAVYSRSLETGEAFAREWKIPIVYTSLDALAESTAVDAAYIASPNAFHYSQSKRMLAGGKHVLCEKPIVTAPEQFDELCFSDGGGVYVAAGGTFTMGGDSTIEGCNARSGGGVYNAGTFTMSGNSCIRNCIYRSGAGSGGVHSAGTFNLILLIYRGCCPM